MANRRVAVFYFGKASRAELEGEAKAPGGNRVPLSPLIRGRGFFSCGHLDSVAVLWQQRFAMRKGRRPVGDPLLWIHQLVCLYAICDMAT